MSPHMVKRELLYKAVIDEVKDKTDKIRKHHIRYIRPPAILEE